MFTDSQWLCKKIMVRIIELAGKEVKSYEKMSRQDLSLCSNTKFWFQMRAHDSL